MKRPRRQAAARDKAPAKEEAQLVITDTGHDGRGIGRVGMIPWFVTDAHLGETVRAVSRKCYANRVEAQTLEVVNPSPHRVEPVCAKHRQCGGCSQQSLSVSQQREQKAQILRRELGRKVELDGLDWAPALVGRSEGYRSRARMMVRQGALGFMGARSHQPVPLSHCPVLHPAINRVLQSVGTLPLAKAEVEFLVDSQNQVGAHVLSVQPMTERLTSQLTDSLSPWVAGLWVTGPDRVRHCLKPASLTFFLPTPQQDLKLESYPWQFSQVNPEINHRMVQQAADWLALGPEDRLLDLFAGSGNFSLALSTQCASVVAVESVASAVAQGEQNARANRLPNVHFVTQDLFVEDWHRHWKRNAFDAVLLDPPRAGADQVSKALGKFDLKQVLYVSCNPATMARDAQTLLQHGFYPVKSCLMDMFPHTGHIESMTLFHKGKRRHG